MTDMEHARKLLDGARFTLDHIDDHRDEDQAIAHAHAAAQIALGYIQLHRFGPKPPAEALAAAKVNLPAGVYTAEELLFYVQEATDHLRDGRGTPVTVTRGE